MKIAVDDLSGPEIAAFLGEHVQQMRAISPPESKHALDLDGLRRPEVTFWGGVTPGLPRPAGARRTEAGRILLHSMARWQDFGSLAAHRSPPRSPGGG